MDKSVNEHIAPRHISADDGRQRTYKCTHASPISGHGFAILDFEGYSSTHVAGEGLPEKIGNAIGLVIIVLLFAMFFYAYSGIFG